MKQFKQLITLFFLIFTCLTFAQTGIVSGTIMDSEFNDVLPYANVVVKGTTKGTTTDFDGKYALELAEGTYTIQYSFVGYETKEITDIIVKANEEVIVDVSIGPANSLEEVVLTSSSKRNTENAVLNLQKKSVMLMDGLSAQTIKKTGASNAASAVKSVPGVSIQGGKYVYVRGLGDRYTKSILNGIDIPGLDPDRNTIQMDIFPTNIIDNVIVIKSAAAEYPADFTGGVVDIITKDFPSKAEYSISAGAGYNSAMHFNDNYLTYSGSKSDFLGYDSGKRDLPINRYQPIPGTFNNSTVLTTLTRRFDSELAAKNDTSGMNFDFGFTAGNQYDLGKNKIGYIASLSYKNNTTFYGDRIDGNYTKDENNSNNNDLLATRLTNGDEGINSIVLNGLAGIVFKTDKSKYKANVLHIQNGESSAGFYLQKLAQGGGNAGFENIQKDALLYTERSITNVLFNGDHKLTDNLDLDWKFSPTFTKVLDKDHRITPLEQNQNGNFSISPSTSSFPIRIWRTLQEEAWNGKVDLVNKYKLFDKAAKFKFGGSYSFKYRDFSTDQYLFTSTTLNVEDGNADNLLAEENLWTTTNQSGTFLNFGQAFQPANSYEGEQNIGALYASNEFNVSEKLKAIVGLRTELYKTFYTGQNQAGDEVFDGEKILDEYDFFPSANLIYAVTDNTNLRASYSRTTARPSFKEASNIQIFDPITNRTFIGNGFGNEFYDAVKPSYVSNFDVRYEWFREEGQMIAISGFYKDFKDPIESVFFPFSPDQLTVANLGNAKVYGVELELRQNLGFITDGLRNLKFKANASLIESELEMAETEYQRRLLAARDGQTIDRTRQLQGQSPFLLNLGFDYSNDGLGLRSGLFYNVQGKALEVVGTGIVPDVYTQPFNSLNFTLNKEFGESKKSSIDLKVTNILGDKRESDYESYNTDNQTFSLRNPGTEISLGYSYKF
ncbi:MAG: TonB-dependent receptor [Flavobacteriaceae bacterium]|nr:TonB-dependent receptor [Flavobacteriaceae bacterium]